MSILYPWFAPCTNSAPYAREPSGMCTGNALAFTPLSTWRAEPPGGAVVKSLLYRLWSTMRHTTQEVPAQNSSCTLAFTRPDADSGTAAVVLSVALRT
jgi:hypothetical protein